MFKATFRKFGYATLTLSLASFVIPPASSSARELASPLASLNQAIAKIVAPFQDQSTQASLRFKRIKTDSVRALKVSVAGDYKKTGPSNTIELRIDHLRYKYGDGTRPTTDFKGFVGVDLTKILPQSDLNQMIPGIQQELQSLVSDSYQEYGDAAKVSVKIRGEQQDAQGNYVSIKATVALHIDLTQLPSSLPSSEVLFTDALAHLDVNLSQGVKLNGVVISNPAYEGFQEDQTGLKEYLDNLLSQDPDTLQDIGGAFGTLNSMAEAIVNGQGPNAGMSLR